MYKFLILLVLSSGSVSAEKLSFQQNLNLSTDRISALDVISGAGDIEISTHSGNEIQVNATITSKKYRTMERFKEVFERDMVFAIDRESEYAVLRGHSKPDLRKNPEIQIHLDIQIPADLDVDIEDGSGDIRLVGLSGLLEIEDGSGAITINQATGKIEIEDGSGAITITDSQGDIDIDDSSGDITLTRVNGQKNIEDSSGDIMVQNSSGDVDIDDGSGDIMLKDIAGSVVINDGSGSIYIDALSGSLEIKSAGSGKVIIDGENRTKEFK